MLTGRGPRRAICRFRSGYYMPSRIADPLSDGGILVVLAALDVLPMLGSVRWPVGPLLRAAWIGT